MELSGDTTERERLKAMMNRYLQALEAHDLASLQLGVFRQLSSASKQGERGEGRSTQQRTAVPFATDV